MSHSRDLKMWISVQIQNIKGSITMLFGDKCVCYIFACMINEGKAKTELREAQWQMFLELKMQMSTEVN